MASNNLPQIVRIAQQIETAADYYPPATYSGTSSSFEALSLSYLTFYNELAINSDALADQFIPLSAVPQHGRNPKLFAVGIIPPTANITGRLLDRSASVNTALPAEPQYATIQTPSGTVNIVNSQVSTSGRELVPNRITKLSERQVREAFLQGFHQVTGQYPSDQVLALLMAQSAHETGQWASLHNYNFGNIKATNWPHQYTTYGAWEVINGQRQDFPANHPQTLFRAYPNASEGAADYILTLLRDNQRRKPPDAWKQALLSGDPVAFSEILSRPPPYYTGSKTAYTRAMTRLYNQYFQLTSVPQDSYNGNWKAQGSENADTAREIQDKVADTPLVSDTLFEQFTAAQKAQILAVQAAHTAMQNTPPMRMLVNPSSFSVKGEKIVSDGGWSRNGNTIVEHWGDQQEKISASGKVAGFYAIDALNAVGPGLTRTARNYSQAWQNFQSLSLFYANNGGLYTADPTASNQRNLSLMGSVYLFYDGILYIGSFDSLNVSEADTAPHTAEYSFEFTVRAAFLLDNPSEANVARQRPVGP